MYDSRMNAAAVISELANGSHATRSRAQKHLPSYVTNESKACISQERRQHSLVETAFDFTTALPLLRNASRRSSAEKTVLYLAYGSNLAAATFLGQRGIKPLSQLNVVVPSLRLTFDLPGIPYTEPCFANTALRDEDDSLHGSSEPPKYHKDRWYKGLVGVVYELSPEDFAHVIATEGGGSGYQDIMVLCHPLGIDDTVPAYPTTAAFKAHTLFAPISTKAAQNEHVARYHRPDPAYAQPSARYLGLLITGAEEHSLPLEYKRYLAQIHHYQITQTRQAQGQMLFQALFGPLIRLMFWAIRIMADENGRIPAWLAQLAVTLFTTIWVVYDNAFRRVFGDGERTMKADEMPTLEKAWDPTDLV